MKGREEMIRTGKHILLIAVAMLLAMGIAISHNSESFAIETSGTEPCTWEITNDGILKIGNPNPDVTEIIGQEDKYPAEWPDYDPTTDGEWTGAQAVDSNETTEKMSNYWGWLENKGISDQVKEIEIVGSLKAVGSLQFIFAGMSNLEQIKYLDKIDVSEVTNLNNLFTYSEYGVDSEGRAIVIGSHACDKLHKIEGIESWNTGNVRHMGETFAGAKALTSLDLSSWNTENLTQATSMFYGLKEITTINLSGWDMSNVKRLSWMFSQCNKLENIIGLDEWDVGNVQQMKMMFNNCWALNTDLSKWYPTDLKTTVYMFNGCQQLKDDSVLDWDMSQVSDSTCMFTNCWNVANALYERILALKKDGAADDDPKVKSLTEARRLILIAAANKDENDNPLDEDTWLDLIKDAAAQYSAAMIADAKAAADAAIKAAVDSENKANLSGATEEDKAKAAEDLKAAHQAVDKVKGMANNTDKSKDKKDAKALATDLEDLETDANTRLAGDLNAKLQEAANAKTEGKSAASVRALNDAIEAANEALTNGDAAAKSKALADLEKAIAGLTDKSNEEKAYDTAKAAADEAKAKADEAKAAYEAAKAKAEEEATKNPGSDAAVKAAEDAKKAAEDYAAKAKDADDKAKAAAEAANKTTDSAIKKAANDAATAAGEEKKAADVANAEAAVAYAEQLEKAAEIAKNNGDLAKAAELENKAAEAWGDAADKADKAGNDEQKANAETKQTQAKDDAKTTAETALNTAIADAKKADTSNATPESKKALEDAIANAEKVLADPASTPEQKAAAAKAVADAIKNLKTIDSKVGQEITVAKNVYVITKDPGATWDGEVSLKTAKNAKNVSVPKVVKHEGKSYEVNRVQAGAFRAKKIRKVTLGANVAKLDAKAFNKSKATTIVLKTKDLTKKSVKGALKGSKVKTVQVKVGSKKVNKKYVKKYKKIFTKKNAGKKVTVK